MTYPGMRRGNNNNNARPPQPAMAPPPRQQRQQQYQPQYQQQRQQQQQQQRRQWNPFGRSQQQTTNYNNSRRAVAQTNASEDFDGQTSRLIPAEVRMISGCHSEQTSADVQNVSSVASLPHAPASGRAAGACTSALLEILYKHHNGSGSGGWRSGGGGGGGGQLTFQQVLLELRQLLDQRGFSQIPQLTASRPLDVGGTPFSLSGTTGGRWGTSSGTKRAVLVGINYRGQNGELRGCHNDVFHMKKYLEEVQGYEPDNVLVLVDDDGKHHYPTRQAIILSLKQLVSQSKSGDSVYFHYSGHGGLLSPDWNPFKASQKEYDETVYPLDHQTAGQIRDFSLFRHFVQPMAAGVTVTAVMDCCHSGSVLELPYSFQPTPAGTIRARQSMDSLTNLAMLSLLMGNPLPPGFGNIAEYIQNSTGQSLDEMFGAGMDDAADDDDEGDLVDNDEDYDDDDAGGDDDDDDAAAAGEVADGNEEGDYGGGDDAPDYGDVGDGGIGGGGDDDAAYYGATAPDEYQDDGGGGGMGGYGFAMPYDMGGGGGGDDDGGGAADDAARGFGGFDFGGGGGGGGDDDDGGGGGGGDVDCGCIQDVLGSLMEDE